MASRTVWTIDSASIRFSEDQAVQRNALGMMLPSNGVHSICSILLKRCQGAGVDLFCSASTFRNCRMRSRCRDFFFRCRSNLALSPFLCDMNSSLRVPGVGLAVANRPRSQSVSSFAL